MYNLDIQEFAIYQN
jgi:chromosome segregation ATPase